MGQTNRTAHTYNSLRSVYRAMLDGQDFYASAGEDMYKIYYNQVTQLFCVRTNDFITNRPIDKSLAKLWKTWQVISAGNLECQCCGDPVNKPLTAGQTIQLCDTCNYEIQEGII